MATDIIARGMAAGVVSQVSADKQAVSEDRNAVEAAKTEVLNVAESIPEDYSTLSADVSELKEDLSDINDFVGGCKIKPLADTEIKINYTFNNKDEYVLTTNKNRACCILTNLIEGIVSIDDNYMFAIDICGDNKQNFVVIDGNTWLSNGVIIPNAIKYNILFKRVDNADLTLSDIDNIKNTFIQKSDYNIYTKDDVYTKAQVDEKLRSRLFGKTITAIGDSFIDYNTQGLGNDLLSKIADGKNMTIHNYGLSSSSLAYDENQAVLSVMDRYQTMINEVPNTDYLLVLAGHNDSNPSLHGGSGIPIGDDDDMINTTFKGALNILCNALLSAYPSANILFLTPFRRRDTELPYCVAIEEICEKYSIQVFNNYKNSGICFKSSAQDELFDNGNYHLNALGNERVARKYIAVLESM